MNKVDALSNAMAVFYYAMWRYTDSIICFTSNGITYTVDIQLEHADFNTSVELERLRAVIAAGAEIRHLQPISATYDVLVINYRFND